MKFISSFILLLAFSLMVHASEEIIKHKYYTLSYNEDYEVANWVSYELLGKNLKNCANRSNSFRPDPMVSTGSAVAADYAGSGYDRGHLLPAGDMKMSVEAMSETFYYSNMTPQPPAFNRGRWSQLENLMRAWAMKYEKIWLVTGPVLERGMPVIGRDNHVAVPFQYFKVILRKTAKAYEAIAFLMSITVPTRELSGYTTTVNHIEELTGVNFFGFIGKDEDEVEGRAEVSNWDFNAKFQYLPCQP